MGIEFSNVAGELSKHLVSNNMPEDVREAMETSGVSFRKYVKIKRLGEGGGGVVWKAYDQELKRYVALKLFDIKDDNIAEKENFYREAETIASLEHPNIVPVFEIGSHNNTRFMSMKFVEGTSLGLYAKEAKKEDLLGVVIKICDALDYSHRNGVIHRDIKPMNILVDKQGGVYLVDFGIAKSANQTVTAGGNIIGTPQYMAPEQVDGATSDHRADIYSLGATMYHCFTGKQPYTGDSTVAIIKSALDYEPRAPSRINSLISRDLEKVILKAMSKAPSFRYTTIADMKEDIRRLLTGDPVIASKPSIFYYISKKLKKHRKLILPLAAFAVIILAVASYFFFDYTSRADAEALFLKGAAMYNGGLADEAVRYLNESLALEPENAEALYLLGMVFWQNKRETQKAIKYFSDAVELDPDSVIYASDLAAAYIEAGDLEKGEELCRKLLERSPGNPAILSNLAAVFYNGNRYKEAYDVYKDAVAADPNNSEVLTSLGATCFTLNRLDEAETYLKKALEINPRNITARINISMAYTSKGEFERALEHADFIIKASPEYDGGYFAKGYAYFFMGRYKEAERFFSAAIDKEAHNIKAYDYLAQSLYYLGDYVRSIEAYREILALAPNSPLIYYSIATCYENLEMYEEQEAALRKCIELYPEYVDAHNELGLALYHQGKYEESVSVMESLLKKHGDNADFYSNLGIVYGAMERYDKAIEMLEKAVELNPSLTQALYNLGYAYFRAGRGDKAFMQHDRLKRIDPAKAEQLKGLIDAH